MQKNRQSMTIKNVNTKPANTEHAVGISRIREIIIGILTLVFIILLSVIISTLGKPRKIANPVEDMQFYVKRHNYNDLFFSVRTNKRRGYEGDFEYKKYEAIGDYYENALAYNAWVVSGKKEKIEECVNNMQDARSRMKEIDIAADEIDDMLFKKDK